MDPEKGALLVVEDDPRLGPIMRDVLAMDWDVSLATTLDQARSLLEDHLFAAAVGEAPARNWWRGCAGRPTPPPC